MSKVLKDLACELDLELGGIENSLSSLNDVEVLLAQLVVDMDTALYKGEEHTRLHEHHRKIRVYSELIRYLVDDLSKEYEKAEDIKNKLHKNVMNLDNKKII